MTEQQEWVPPDVDTSVPNIARAYDYALGGGHNFAVDRDFIEAAERVLPSARQVARLNRSFLRRAVLFLVEQGIRQFLDLGSGIPTVGNVHEVAQDAAPDCRVVYVDKEPIAVSHSVLMLRDNDRAAAIQADLRYPKSVFDQPEIRELLDFDQPIGLLMLMVLHYVPDDWNPWDVIAEYRDALPPGSFLVISHLTDDQRPDQWTEVAQLVRRSRTADQLSYRSHAEVVRFFDGFELVEPGVVGDGLWRPAGPGDFSDDPDVNVHVYAGVGYKSR